MHSELAQLLRTDARKKAKLGWDGYSRPLRHPVVLGIAPHQRSSRIVCGLDIRRRFWLSLAVADGLVRNQVAFDSLLNSRLMSATGNQASSVVVVCPPHLAVRHKLRVAGTACSSP
ncbi:RP non-ATPase subunit 8A [Striga asiatica]|uniref:RP non-ATPase subunit 8A n=1 Tax=Striga asiatica TaxID=4170 RepID=A0A5A7PB25_STRAF|nr:RP non-ATPase subunit 8A [Striga asiatica]